MGYATKILIHVAILVLSFIVAYELRRGLPLEWWLTNSEARLILLWGIVYGGIGGLLELLFKVERSAWRFSSIRDAFAILRNTALTSLAFLALIFLSSRAITLPRSTLLLAWLLSFVGLVGIRMLWRLMHSPGSLTGINRDARSGDSTPLLIVGDLAAADVQIRHLELSNPDNFRPIGIVATDASTRGLHVKGVPVLGHLADLSTLVRAALPTAGERAIVFLEDPAAGLQVSPATIGALRKEGVALLRLPRVVELAQGDAGAGRLRQIALEEFLPRQPISIDPAPLRSLISGRKVLVTGAGGSIGSELCRQLSALGCSALCALDHAEYGLFEIDRELRSAHPYLILHPILADVRDADRIEQVFAEHRPALVFHAAALKHVTLVEMNPEEGFFTNVLGTHNVVEACKRSGVSQMTFISTDKAVEPTSIMGATKRIAEALVAGQSDDVTRFATVRFGNVLGSAGSVIPIFQSQIEAGGPVTVTDPDVERYFMTIPEAVQLVLHASVLASEGEGGAARRYVLDMGDPVKILDLAEQLIRLYGLIPGEDIQIVFTGLKPGEKISERLTEPGDIVEERLKGVLEVTCADSVTAVDGAAAARLAEKMSRALASDRVRAALEHRGVRRALNAAPEVKTALAELFGEYSS